MLNDLKGRSPQVAAQIGLHSTKVLHVMATLEFSPRHGRGEYYAVVGLDIVDIQVGQVIGVGHHATQPSLMADILNRREEVPQFKVFVPRELILAGLG